MLATLFGVSGDPLVALTRAYSETYVRLTKTLERPFPDTIGMLQRLRERGWLLAIATGKSQNGAENATRRMALAPLFDGIHGIIPGTPGKPDVLMRAMADLGVLSSPSWWGTPPSTWTWPPPPVSRAWRSRGVYTAQKSGGSLTERVGLHHD